MLFKIENMSDQIGSIYNEALHEVSQTKLKFKINKIYNVYPVRLL